MDSPTIGQDEDGSWYAYTYYGANELGFGKGATREEAILDLLKAIGGKLVNVIDAVNGR